MNRKFVLKNVLALGMVMVGLSSAVAQTTQAYPVNRVTLVTHSSPGGGSDVFLRDLAKFISPIMKTNLAVENIRGGSGAKAVAHTVHIIARIFFTIGKKINAKPVLQTRFEFTLVVVALVFVCSEL